MTPEQLAYLEWIKAYCNNNFLDSDGNENIPSIITIVIDKLIEYDKNTGVQSESLGDHSITYTADYPPNILKLLRPYRKVRFV